MLYLTADEKESVVCNDLHEIHCSGEDLSTENQLLWHSYDFIIYVTVILYIISMIIIYTWSVLYTILIFLYKKRVREKKYILLWTIFI